MSSEPHALIELKPCPFCSNPARYWQGYDSGKVGCGGHCPIAAAYVAMSPEDWNTRALLALTPAAGEPTLDDEGYLWKWVERGLFDRQISAAEALSVIAHHPSAPWNKGRWEVDHKPYAKAFYADFPKAKGPKP